MTIHNRLIILSPKLLVALCLLQMRSLLLPFPLVAGMEVLNNKLISFKTHDSSESTFNLRVRSVPAGKDRPYEDILWNILREMGQKLYLYRPFLFKAVYVLRTSLDDIQALVNLFLGYDQRRCKSNNIALCRNKDCCEGRMGVCTEVR